ncbi:MAG: hypothetical protein IJB86_08060 [Clostridia bacterium]|nr:hypothetical protein [Clostridia bacterium]
MKKIIFPVLIAAFLCASLFGCSGEKKYKLVEVPEELQINTQSLSEDPAKLLDYNEDYPLFFAEPESDVYAYVCSNQSDNGILVKFDGYIQYFSWRMLTPTIAKPDVHVADYNNDGLQDIAVTVLSNVGETNYNEDLHILMNRDGSLEDCLYTHETCAIDAKGILTFSENNTKDDSYFFFINGKRQEIEIKNKGDFFGMYFDAVQDFTLGNTITVEVVPGLSFSDSAIPDYSLATFCADINYNNGVFEMSNPAVEY